MDARSVMGFTTKLAHALDSEDVQAKIFDVVIRPVLDQHMAALSQALGAKVGSMFIEFKEDFEKLIKMPEVSPVVVSEEAPICLAAAHSTRPASRKRRMRRKRCTENYHYCRERLLQAKADITACRNDDQEDMGICLEQRIQNLEIIITSAAPFSAELGPACNLASCSDWEWGPFQSSEFPEAWHSQFLGAPVPEMDDFRSAEPPDQDTVSADREGSIVPDGFEIDYDDFTFTLAQQDVKASSEKHHKSSLQASGPKTSFEAPSTVLDVSSNVPNVSAYDESVVIDTAQCQEVPADATTSSPELIRIYGPEVEGPVFALRHGFAPNGNILQLGVYTTSQLLISETRGGRKVEMKKFPTAPEAKAWILAGRVSV